MCLQALENKVSPGINIFEFSIQADGSCPICAKNELFKNAFVGEVLTDFVYPVLGKHVVLKTTV